VGSLPIACQTHDDGLMRSARRNLQNARIEGTLAASPRCADWQNAWLGVSTKIPAHSACGSGPSQLGKPMFQLYSSEFHDQLDKKFKRLHKLLSAKKPHTEPTAFAKQIMDECAAYGWPIYPSWAATWGVQGFLASGRFSVPPLPDDFTADTLYDVFESMTWLILGPPKAELRRCNRVTIQQPPSAYYTQKHQGKLLERCAEYLSLRGQDVGVRPRGGQRKEACIEARAKALLFDNPKLTNLQIAEILGCNSSYLSQLPRLKIVRQQIKGIGAESLHHSKEHFRGDQMDLYGDDD